MSDPRDSVPLPGPDPVAFAAALAEGQRFFMGEAKVQDALRALVEHLEEAEIDYAIAGAMALNAYGYHRFTSDVDVLLTADGLARFKAARLGRGYLERFPGSRGLRDTTHAVDIDVLLTGDYPGDGKPKAVRFPEPSAVAERLDVGAFLPLRVLVELKLASGLSAPHRLKDLSDVLELIRAASLPRELATELDASVRDEYLRLWEAAAAAPDPG